ncbi:bacteriocin immunity protein [Pseudomonas sp. RGM 3321]|uniref:bacteriocin immunity protein n=1 Tax=Pseudomonas sp. RGM 3321 TaxID=2930089 RepID=UPI001FCA7A77|nr:bacteriocin immunity protein [Pseudomonas sp. RGM 3321]MCJ2371457.1 bacteriocin immunity protein [Pseudomonas sp. RGM 3321]
MNLKERLEDYTEQELIELMNKIWQADVNSEDEHDTLISHFVSVMEHPLGTDLIFYPESHDKDNPLAILELIKNCRSANGKSGFKLTWDDKCAQSPTLHW